ncbi:4Fe-4S dicluster domain-containing protein [Peptacetobacter sp.]|uniref:4Fe-4S dicluster domain-containing protein n=1 Tax=Peptacetobacter sp. TaxID=2991975 RepID=UPI002627782E|nr:4Fe-4S dicluster domain-containing protein [Peptacetobacter sp.]
MKNIIYNIGLCNGCFDCHTACAKIHSDKGGQSCRKMKRIDNPIDNSLKLITDACRHCDDPTCANNCPQFALSVDPITGFVILDEDKCIGCQICSFVCPFDVPKFINGKMVKCDGCNDRVKKGLLPACVESCERNALQLVEN